jgi:hypothetical protein
MLLDLHSILRSFATDHHYFYLPSYDPPLNESLPPLYTYVLQTFRDTCAPLYMLFATHPPTDQISILLTSFTPRRRRRRIDR